MRPPPTTVRGPSNRARATISSSRSPVQATPWHARCRLQRAPLAPIRLRIGVHAGEVPVRERALHRPDDQPDGRFHDIAHGGQTVLSGTTSDLVIDRLPEGAS